MEIMVEPEIQLCAQWPPHKPVVTLMGKRFLWVLVTVIAFSIVVGANITATNQTKNGQFTAQGAGSSGQKVGTKIVGSLPLSLPDVSSAFPILSLVAAIGVDRFLRYRKRA